MDDDIPRLLPAPLGAWAARGLCVDADDPDVFYPEDGSRGTKARRICAPCPVQADCLEYALEANEEFGIWGGLDRRERRNLKRRRATGELRRPGDAAPEQRRQRAKIAANARWSRHMAREDHAAVMGDVMRERLEREVDPDGKLPPDERAKLVRAAARRQAAMLNAAKARRRAVRYRADS